jgi:hypothetical protein
LIDRFHPMAALARSSPEIESLSAAAFLLRDARAPLNRAEARSRNLSWIPLAQNGSPVDLLSSRALSDSAMRREH